MLVVFRQHIGVCISLSSTMASKSSSTGNKQFQKKTPNKSGLTPVRPNKSPGNGMKLRSGLTPVRPEILHGQQQPSKSPFKSPGSGLKKKSGLTPVRPGMQGSAKKSFNLSTDQHQQQKLKSGLLPIKPGINIHNTHAHNKLQKCTVNWCK